MLLQSELTFAGSKGRSVDIPFHDTPFSAHMPDQREGARPLILQWKQGRAPSFCVEADRMGFVVRSVEGSALPLHNKQDPIDRITQEHLKCSVQKQNSNLMFCFSKHF